MFERLLSECRLAVLMDVLPAGLSSALGTFLAPAGGGNNQNTVR
jgi:hypothetical protein